jgi:crossover junction endodeoxyribonuclease RuvC
MRVCGIDCGTETTGYGVVEWDGRSPSPELVWLDAGGISPARKAHLPQRLAAIHTELVSLLERWRPDVVAVEEVFYSVNAKSAIRLGHVRGVALLAAASAGIPVAEYAPLTIKSTVTGYGLAAKHQVQFMVARLLGLAAAPEPADAADALAIAICHIHHAQTLALQEARAI